MYGRANGLFLIYLANKCQDTELNIKEGATEKK